MIICTISVWNPSAVAVPKVHHCYLAINFSEQFVCHSPFACAPERERAMQRIHANVCPSAVRWTSNDIEATFTHSHKMHIVQLALTVSSGTGSPMADENTLKFKAFHLSNIRSWIHTLFSENDAPDEKRQLRHKCTDTTRTDCAFAIIYLHLFEIRCNNDNMEIHTMPSMVCRHQTGTGRRPDPSPAPAEGVCNFNTGLVFRPFINNVPV